MNAKAPPNDFDKDDTSSSSSTEEEEGNLEDSDEEGDEVHFHNDELCKVNNEERAHECDAMILDFGNGEIFHLDREQTMLVEGQAQFGREIPGAPKGWAPPCAPLNWKGYDAYERKSDAPASHEIDNPGNWNLYSFAPKYDGKTKKYIGHFTPGGARVVSADARGDREKNGWKFYYKEWLHDDFDKRTFVRNDSTRDNIKPSSRRGSLDADVLKRHGLTEARVSTDALFFFQLLFPIADPAKSGIDGDNRLPYFHTLRSAPMVMLCLRAEDLERVMNSEQSTRWNWCIGLPSLFATELMMVDRELSGNDGTMTIPGMTHTLMAPSVAPDGSISRDISN
jgi:hypothetical protein